MALKLEHGADREDLLKLGYWALPPSFSDLVGEEEGLNTLHLQKVLRAVWVPRVHTLRTTGGPTHSQRRHADSGGCGGAGALHQHGHHQPRRWVGHAN